jgi:hypothetical protein
MRSRTTAQGVRVAGALLATVAALTLTTACSKEAEDKKPVVGKEDDGTRRGWLQCMHDAGQTQVKMTQAGQIVMPAGRPGDSDTAMAEAVKKCNSKVPGMQQLGRAKPDSESIKQARGLATCLRKNGVPDMADPEPKQPDTLVTPTGVDPKAWNKAFGICGKDYPDVPFAAEKPQKAGE